MVAWFVIAIATLAVFAYIAVSGVQNVSTTSDAVARVETARRLDGIANSLLARAAPATGDGTIYLLAGANNSSGGGYGVPGELALQGQTQFGQPFVYCPFGANGGTGSALNIPSADGAVYTVATTGYMGKNYVTGGRPPWLVSTPNILGFVMAPRTKLSASPSCDQVTFNSADGKYEAPDAVVRVVTRDAGVDEGRTISSRMVTFFVSPSGNGTGSSANDPASMATAISYYLSRVPPFMTINVAPGTYTFTDSTLHQYDANKHSILWFRAAAANTVTFTMSPAGGTIEPLDKIVFNNINIAPGMQLFVAYGQEAKLISGSFGDVTNVGGKVLIRGNVTINGSVNSWAYWGGDNAWLDISDATLNVSSVQGYGIDVDSGTLSAHTAHINFVAGSSSGQWNWGLYTNTLGKTICGWCTITFTIPVGTNSAGLGIFGEADFQYTTITGVGGAGWGVQLGAAAKAAFNQSDVGGGSGRWAWAVVDSGASAIDGGGTNFHQGSGGCFWGTMFADSNQSSSSAVLGDVPVPAMSDPITAAQSQAYSDAVSTNARRAVRRQVNQSSWACQP